MSDRSPVMPRLRLNPAGGGKGRKISMAEGRRPRYVLSERGPAPAGPLRFQSRFSQAVVNSQQIKRPFPRRLA